MTNEHKNAFWEGFRDGFSLKFIWKTLAIAFNWKEENVVIWMIVMFVIALLAAFVVR